MSDEAQLTRRELLAKTGRAAAGVGLGLTLGERLTAGLARPAFAQDSKRTIGANDRIVLGLIGAGGQGRSDMDGLMNQPHVEIAAVCDPDSGHMAEAAQMVEKKFGRRPAEHKDFRQVLE